MGIAALKRIQTGLESPAGDKVPATARLIGTLTMEEMLTLSRPIEDRGSLADVHKTVIAGEAVDLAFDGDLTFEQVIYLLNMGVIAVASGVGEGDDKTWTFVPVLTAANIPQSLTIEYGDDIAEHEVEYCVAKALEFSGSLDAPLKMKADIFGRNLAVDTFTADLVDPAVLEAALMNKTVLSIDPIVTGTIGDTPKSATLIDFSWKLTTGFVPKKHGGAALFFDSVGEQRKKVVLNATFEFNAGAEAERVLYAAGTRRLFRLQTLGTLITVGIYKTLTLDLAGVYTKWATLVDKDGADTVAVTIESEYDPTWEKMFEIVVINKVATLI